MDQSANNPATDRSGIVEALTATVRQPSFLRVVLILAATMGVLVVLRLGAPILNPILFAVVMTLLFSPIYSWLLRRGLPAPLASLIMLILLAVSSWGSSLSWAPRSAGLPSASGSTRRSSTCRWTASTPCSSAWGSRTSTFVMWSNPATSLMLSVRSLTLALLPRKQRPKVRSEHRFQAKSLTKGDLISCLPNLLTCGY
jgi:hypothetical protein